MPHVIKNIGQMNPRELTTILMAYTDQGFFNDIKDSYVIPDTNPDKDENEDTEEEEKQLQTNTIKNIELLKAFEGEFKGKFEQMNPEDISKYYYCFTSIGHYGSGRFYKYLQKALTKTIKRFESANLRLMFTNFDSEKHRLNRGVKGRLQDRLEVLVRAKEMKGYDV